VSSFTQGVLVACGATGLLICLTLLALIIAGRRYVRRRGGVPPKVRPSRDK
jgi:hypothetical protein